MNNFPWPLDKQQRDVFTLGIAHDANSRGGSKFMHKQLKIGDELVFSRMASDLSA
jgi:ferredoxin-NADP reductase